MTSYAISTTLDQPFETALEATRDALADQGFGVLTEIDLRATLKARLDVDVEPQVILGACRPPLAHAALQAEPSIGLLLPCNVVVRSVGPATTLVEAALAEQGFGVLTEIDVAATIERKLGKQVPAQVILGACNPQLADQALVIEPSIGLLLPCNVVIRDSGDGRTIVSALDPAVMVTFTGNPELTPIAEQARARVTAALQSLSGAGAG